MNRAIPRRVEQRQVQSDAGLSAYVIVFLFGLIVPIQIFIGDFRLSAYRIILLVLIIPCLIRLITSQVGKLVPSDILLILFVCWGALALAVAHPFGEAFESIGIYGVETLGAYLLGRCFVRNERQFETVVKIIFFTLIVLSPFALYECLTQRPIILDVMSKVFSVFPNVPHEQRWGLDRAQVVFEHPILYGVYCASAFALSYYVLGFGRPFVAKLVRIGTVTVATAFSLSSGALSAIALQGILMGWDAITRGVQRRWTILASIFGVAYMFVDLFSNRAPLVVFISYLTFSPHTAWGRIAIWDAGSAEVMRNPLFGIGLKDEWERPAWVGSSVDNFWLLIAMRYGIPALLLFVAAVVHVAVSLGRLQDPSPRLASYRTGLLVYIAGLAVAGSTVHFWNATYCLYLFLLGSGVWMVDAAKREKARITPPVGNAREVNTAGRQTAGTRNAATRNLR